MAERRPARYHVALQGFSEFERGALAACLRLASERSPAFEQVASLDDCDLVIADADQPATVAALAAAGRSGDAVFVGARRPPEGGAWLPRPIDPARILRELDGLVQRNEHPPLDTEPGAEALARPARDVLVVDDSRIALKFLQLRLQRMGYRVHLARDGQQAIDKLKAHRFAVVFLDIVLGPEGSIDGLALCQYIKRRGARDGNPPAVVMVTGLGSETDRVRGSLAGCDAYLVKPLMDDDFTAALRGLRLPPL